jgi:hypothetical protein
MAQGRRRDKYKERLTSRFLADNSLEHYQFQDIRFRETQLFPGLVIHTDQRVIGTVVDANFGPWPKPVPPPQYDQNDPASVLITVPPADPSEAEAFFIDLL